MLPAVACPHPGSLPCAAPEPVSALTHARHATTYLPPLPNRSSPPPFWSCVHSIPLECACTPMCATDVALRCATPPSPHPQSMHAGPLPICCQYNDIIKCFFNCGCHSEHLHCLVRPHSPAQSPKAIIAYSQIVVQAISISIRTGLPIGCKLRHPQKCKTEATTGANIIYYCYLY